MLQLIFSGIVALAALMAILEYCGVKPKQPLWGLVMPVSRNWKLAVMLALVAASLGMSGYSFYRSLYPKTVEFNVDNAKVIEVRGRTFTNEVVQLDNHRYEDCTFVNVTFEYQGTSYIQMAHNQIVGSKLIKTDNRSITASIMLLQALGVIPASIPILEDGQRRLDLAPKVNPGELKEQ